MTLIKICGITNIEDAVECVRLGANMLGFVFADSPRRANLDTVRHISRIIGGDARTVGVFTEESDEVISIANDCNLTYAQLHGGQSEGFARRLSTHRVIRVARVHHDQLVPVARVHHDPLVLSSEERSVSKDDWSSSALRYDPPSSGLLSASGVYGPESIGCLGADFPTAALYLLDTYRKDTPGGTGETFDWSLAARAKSLGKPIILSGGLNPENVAGAIAAAQPYAVDVSSGVEESPGKKDLTKVKEFIANVRRADNRA